MGVIKTLTQLLVTAVVIAGGLLALDEATKYHGGVESVDGQTTVVFTVDTQGFRHDPDVAANLLWQYCAGPIDEWDTMSPPQRQADATYVASIRPSVVEHTRSQLTGCLDDMTIDNVLGHVQRVTDTQTVND